MIKILKITLLSVAACLSVLYTASAIVNGHTTRATIQKCPGEALSVTWRPENAYACTGTWSSQTNYPVMTTVGSKSYGDTSRFSTGMHTLTYSCTNGLTPPLGTSVASVNFRNDSGCLCGSGSTASLCSCPVNQTRYPEIETTYSCPSGYIQSGTGASTSCYKNIYGRCKAGGVWEDDVETSFECVADLGGRWYRGEIRRIDFAAAVSSDITVYKCQAAAASPVVDIHF